MGEMADVKEWIRLSVSGFLHQAEAKSAVNSNADAFEFFGFSPLDHRGQKTCITHALGRWTQTSPSRINEIRYLAGEKSCQGRLLLPIFRMIGGFLPFCGRIPVFDERMIVRIFSVPLCSSPEKGPHRLS